MSVIAVALAACGYEPSSSQTVAHDADPPGWHRVTFAQAVSLSIPPDGEYREYANIEGQSAHLATPRFHGALHYTKNVNAPPGNPMVAAPGETRQEERITVGGLPARLVRVQRPTNPAAAKRSPRELSSFPIGIDFLIERAGPEGRDILAFFGCDEQPGCDEAGRIVRSLRLIASPNGTAGDSKLPSIPPPR